MNISFVVTLVFCLLNVVAAAIPSASLSCNETGLTVTFNKTELDAPGRNYTIKFSEQSSRDCVIDHGTSSNIQGDDLWIHAEYNECGIDAVQEGDNIIYNQTVVVTYGNNPNSSLVHREEKDEYNLRCVKSRNFTESASVFNVTRTMGRTAKENASANFEIELVRYDTSSFTTPARTTTLKLGDMFYFQLKLKNPRADIGMYPQQCYATKKDFTGRYHLIKDRCANSDDGTVWILTSTSNTKIFRWKNEAFRYFGNSDAIYIHCDVLVCIGSSGIPCTRCSGRRRGRRDLAQLNGNAQPDIQGRVKEIGVTSPLVVLIDEVSNANDDGNDGKSVFSGSKGTIIIVLMALFVFIVAVGVIKKCFFSSASTALVPDVPLMDMESSYKNTGKSTI